jgi:uncharacterized protein
MSRTATRRPIVRSAATIEVMVRVYGPLNDFLPVERRQRPWRRIVDGPTTVKDLIESLGVPHPEIDLILANGTSAAFDYLIRTGDRIAVFPRFTTFDVGALTRVRPSPLATIRFIADVHLGTLARRLRLAGFDTSYRDDADDATLADTAQRESRVLLTRDQALLKRRTVAYGYFIRSTDPHDQFVEVLRRFGPLELHPFSRCLRCNGMLREVPKSSVDAALLPRTRQDFDRFHRCEGCGRIYWRGSHWTRLNQALDDARKQAETG